MLAAFGPERCVWGSDFPCEHWLENTTYAQHLAVFTEELGLSTAEQEQVLGATAMRLFFSLSMTDTRCLRNVRD